MDIGKVLAAVARVVGEGAQNQYNVQTLGPDWQAKVQQVKMAAEAAQRAKELHGFEVQDQADEQRDRDVKRQTQIELAGGNPADVPKYGAALAQDELDREREKHEAGIGLTKAQTALAAAKPEDADKDRELKAQQLEQRAKEAEMRGMLAEARGLQAQANFERQEARREGEEARRVREQEGKGRLPESAKDKWVAFDVSMNESRRLKPLLQSPEVQQMLGPLSGLAAGVAFKRLGGMGLSPKQQETVLMLQAALSQEAFSNGGKQLTPTELERFILQAPQETDTLGQALIKYERRQRILEESAKARWLMSSELEQRQLWPMIKVHGLQGIEYNSPAGETDGMPPPSKSPVPGAPSIGGSSSVDSLLKKYGYQ